MKRMVILISLLLILASFRPEQLKTSKSISKDKTPKTIALIHHKYLYFVPIKLNNRNANLLLDTGAAASLLDINQSDKYKFTFNETDSRLAGIGGLSSRYNVANCKFEHDSIMLKVYPFGANLKLVVESFDADGMPIVGVLGSDFLRSNDAIIDYKNKELIIHN